jgi:hypothetical protein
VGDESSLGDIEKTPDEMKDNRERQFLPHIHAVWDPWTLSACADSAQIGQLNEVGCGPTLSLVSTIAMKRRQSQSAYLTDSDDIQFPKVKERALQSLVVQ